MRNEKEVRAAIQHMREALPGTDAVTGPATLGLIDALLWVLGEPSRFEYFVKSCDNADAAERN